MLPMTVRSTLQTSLVMLGEWSRMAPGASASGQLRVKGTLIFRVALVPTVSDGEGVNVELVAPMPMK